MNQARILFHCPSRRGLGHVMRGSNLARAVLAADDGAAVLVHVANPAAGPACVEVPWLATPAEAGAWADVCAAFRPTLVVFDTLLPSAWAAATPAQAFVWRASVDARQAATAGDPRLRAMRRVVVPHEAGEMPQIPEDLTDRVVWTGPIVRGTDIAGQARVRRRYGLAPSDTVITSTVGGGGFDDSAAWLLDLVCEAHARWRALVPRLRHIVVRGPLAAATTTAAAVPDGLTLVDADPDLVHLMAISTLVVAEAGYNTVHELRHVGVPAVLAPGSRTYDDQPARAHALARLGQARVVDRGDRRGALETLAALPTDHSALAAMRAAAAAAPLVTGNARAAAALLDVAR